MRQFSPRTFVLRHETDDESRRELPSTTVLPVGTTRVELDENTVAETITRRIALSTKSEDDEIRTAFGGSSVLINYCSKFHSSGRLFPGFGSQTVRYSWEVETNRSRRACIRLISPYLSYFTRVYRLLQNSHVTEYLGRTTQ